ncbi:hypothetical protein C8R44DRAFT_855386 [Mycena epipterygia]|nr:hypothetical protein C8R44DRAFT_855386 [Mycena epipterygia]
MTPARLVVIADIEPLSCSGLTCSGPSRSIPTRQVVILALDLTIQVTFKLNLGFPRLYFTQDPNLSEFNTNPFGFNNTNTSSTARQYRHIIDRSQGKSHFPRVFFPRLANFVAFLSFEELDAIRKPCSAPGRSCDCKGYAESEGAFEGRAGRRVRGRARVGGREGGLEGVEAAVEGEEGAGESGCGYGALEGGEGALEGGEGVMEGGSWRRRSMAQVRGYRVAVRSAEFAIDVDVDVLQAGIVQRIGVHRSHTRRARRRFAGAERVRLRLAL